MSGATPAVTYNGTQLNGPPSVGSLNQPLVLDGAGGFAGASVMMVGDLRISNSVDSIIVSSRNVVDGTNSNAHAFSDSSFYTRNGKGFNSFDARPRLGKTGDTYDHYSGFQAIPNIMGGTWPQCIGIYSQLSVETGAIVSEAVHIQCAPQASDQWADGLGAIGDETFIQMPVMTDSHRTGTLRFLQCLDSTATIEHAGPATIAGLLSLTAIDLSLLPQSDPVSYGRAWVNISTGVVMMSLGSFPYAQSLDFSDSRNSMYLAAI